MARQSIDSSLPKASSRGLLGVIQQEVAPGRARDLLYSPSRGTALQTLMTCCLGSLIFGGWAGIKPALGAEDEDTGGIIFDDDGSEGKQNASGADDDTDQNSAEAGKQKARPGGERSATSPSDSASVAGPPPPPQSKNETHAMGTQDNLEEAPSKTPESLLSSSPSQHVFGQYRIRLGGSKPEFSNQLKYYDSLYGASSYYPSFSADWYAFDWYATFGVSLRTGFYTDEGKAGRGVAAATNKTLTREDITADTLQKDPEAATTLTLLPLQVAAIFQFTPFDLKWIVLDGWFGLERLYFQEVRAASSASSQAATGTGSGSDTVLTNNGFKNGVLYGFGANIRIDKLDESTSLSLKSMGLNSVYLSPSYEVVQQSDKGVNFSRVVTSLAFVFESQL